MPDQSRANVTPHRQARLWEIDHPYYCSESNYYSRDAGPHDHASWADFMGGIGSMDEDLNLVFRWDWMADETDWESDPEQPVHPEDDYYRGYTLHLFFVMQRKGIFVCHRVSVCRADEAAVRAWLEGRWAHLAGMWAPVSAPALTVPDGASDE